MKLTMKKSIIITFVLFMLISISGCSGSGEPSLYNAAKGAPYEGLYEVDRMNSSNSYSNMSGTNVFTVKMSWKTKNENIDHAEFSDEYYLEWAFEDYMPYELCEPVNDMSALKNNKYSIKPGEDVTINFDVDSYFDGLSSGFYKFVKVLDVYYKDGTVKQEVVAFEFDMS